MADWFISGLSMIYITILYDLHKLYVTLCWKTLQVGICLLSTQSTKQGITPCFGGVGAEGAKKILVFWGRNWTVYLVKSMTPLVNIFHLRYLPSFFDFFKNFWKFLKKIKREFEKIKKSWKCEKSSKSGILIFLTSGENQKKNTDVEWLPNTLFSLRIV